MKCQRREESRARQRRGRLGKSLFIQKHIGRMVVSVMMSDVAFSWLPLSSVHRTRNSGPGLYAPGAQAMAYCSVTVPCHFISVVTLYASVHLLCVDLPFVCLLSSYLFPLLLKTRAVLLSLISLYILKLGYLFPLLSLLLACSFCFGHFLFV